MNTTKQTSLSRRSFLQGSTALGVAAAAGPRLAFGADHKVLRIRS